MKTTVPNGRLSSMDAFTLFVAQGCGVGRAPRAPGTFGSLVGLPCAWGLLWVCPNPAWFGAACVAGIAASVWICGQAERIMKATDPGSVVLDEIIALPICFAGWLLIYWSDQHQMPGVDTLLSPSGWILTIGVFGMFRVFDIAKPWPVFQIQRLPRGWGVTLDDVAAAVYVNAAVILLLLTLRSSG